MKFNYAEEKNRYAVKNEAGEEIGEITWSNAGEDVMIVDHTYVNPDYRGNKIAQQLVFQAAEVARRDDKKIIPLCPFAKKEFETKPEYQDVWRR
ncbi:GNAT family N-acetyltransferase [Enterococcus timonensis]|uniref:GNAT family N-acetyltransferase n=1 Tax=Enterococcus timonensis TaxID=1852364 RepID=UPI0008D994B5|nr:GNAT family N-acetyltransferase [Enterococcus timonensis]